MQNLCLGPTEIYLPLQDENKQKIRLGSKNTIGDTFKKIEAAANDLSLSVQRLNNKVQVKAISSLLHAYANKSLFKRVKLKLFFYQIKMHPARSFTRCSRSHSNLSAEVIETSHFPVIKDQMAGNIKCYIVLF